MARKAVPDSFKVFPKRLSSLMKENNLRQQDLADFLGVKRQTISLYMTGQSTPDAEQLKNIAVFFKVSSDWLLGLSDVKSTDIDQKQVCEYTGLSDIAVWCIRNLTEKSPDLRYILNALFEHEVIDAFVEDILEIRNINRFISATKEDDPYLESEKEENAVEAAQKLLVDAGVTGRVVLSSGDYLGYKISIFERDFINSMGVLLYDEDGIFNSDFE